MCRKKILGIAILVAYIIFVIYLAVLSRDTVQQTYMGFDLFRCYRHLSESLHDIVVNIVCFIPIGVLVGVLSRRYRVVKALLAGVLLSLAIEWSQWIWHRGMFDVNDIFNNAMGAVIGGVIVILLTWLTKRAGSKKGRG